MITISSQTHVHVAKLRSSGLGTPRVSALDLAIVIGIVIIGIVIGMPMPTTG